MKLAEQLIIRGVVRREHGIEGCHGGGCDPPSVNPTSTSRVHHAARRRRGGVAARGPDDDRAAYVAGLIDTLEAMAATEPAHRTARH